VPRGTPRVGMFVLRIASEREEGSKGSLQWEDGTAKLEITGTLLEASISCLRRVSVFSDPMRRFSLSRDIWQGGVGRGWEGVSRDATWRLLPVELAVSPIFSTSCLSCASTTCRHIRYLRPYG
jgi:hypothetical protein